MKTILAIIYLILVFFVTFLVRDWLTREPKSKPVPTRKVEIPPDPSGFDEDMIRFLYDSLSYFPEIEMPHNYGEFRAQFDDPFLLEKLFNDVCRTQPHMIFAPDFDGFLGLIKARRKHRNVPYDPSVNNI